MFWYTGKAKLKIERHSENKNGSCDHQWIMAKQQLQVQEPLNTRVLIEKPK